MRIPVIRGLIERRLLVNYRVAPEVLARWLPPRFQPKLHRGFAMAGICLIRLRGLRPWFLPAWLGISSENAAHRIAVEWDENGTHREGVYVRRRDTDSRWNTLAGGRIFPGMHSHARFDVHETSTHFEVALESDDGVTKVAVAGDLAAQLPATSVFRSLAEASEFFEGGSLGYSATGDPRRLDGLELRCDRWHIEPLEVTRVQSSFFDDPAAFPPGSIEFDCALLMRDIAHEWHSQPDFCCSQESLPAPLEGVPALGSSCSVNQ